MSAAKLNSIVADPVLRAKLEAKLWPRVDRRGEDECWPYRSAVYRTGYGTVNFDGTATTAHRVAFALANGRITEGMHIRHKCDYPPCCNPKHLVEGTNYDNVCDMMERRRHGGKKSGAVRKTRYASGEIRTTDRQRSARRDCAKRRWADPEYRQFMRQVGLDSPRPSFLGRTHSPETKEKLRTAAIAQRARERAQKQSQKT